MSRRNLIGCLVTVAAWLGTGTLALAEAQPAGGDNREAERTLAEVQTYLHALVPAFIMPAGAADWNVQAQQLRQRFLTEGMLRGVPEKWTAGATRVVWGETLPGQGYLIRKLRYEVAPGFWVGGLLYEPQPLKGQAPAVLNTNGHVGPRGLAIEYKQARCINLAKRGMLALSTEFIGHGQLSGPGYAHNEIAYMDLCGCSGVSVFYLALKRALDVLEMQEATDPRRVAVTGLSGGGWQTIIISALDQRVKLAAPNAGYSGTHSRIEGLDLGDLEQNPSDFLAIADYVHLTALLAPRPALLIYNEKDDCCFPAARAIPSVYEPVAPLYKLLGRLDCFAYHVNKEPGTHNYLKDNREAFYRFCNKHFLAPDARLDNDIPVAGEIRKPEELAVVYPAKNADFFTLAAELMQSLPAVKRPANNAPELPQWHAQTRACLKGIVRVEPYAAAVEPPPSRVTTTAPVAGVAGVIRLLRVGEQWTLATHEYIAADGEPKGVTLVLNDEGKAKANDLIESALKQRQRVFAVDLLLTGENTPARGDKSMWAMLVASLGHRPLGLQVGQLNALLGWLNQKYPGQPVRVVARGRMDGLAALTFAALQPGLIEHIKLYRMDKSLKDLLANKVRYADAPSVFCFGLLEAVDILDLLDLAAPTRIEMAE